MSAEAAGIAQVAPEGTTLVALVGRQNSGKTSLLMHLTGSAQRPVNFPGTSVERVESSITVGDHRLRVVDLPGIGSLQPVSRDETLAVDFLRGSTPPDVLCVVVDAAKLTVELQLLGSVLALGRPVVVALNKGDVASREGRPVNAAALAELLQVEVVETDGLRGRGIERLRQALLRARLRPRPSSLREPPDVIAERVTGRTPAGVSLTDRLDAVLLHRFFGLPILGLVMLGAFQLVYSGTQPFLGWIETAQGALAALVRGLLPAGALQSFLVDGLIQGAFAILGFLPQIVLLVALVALLEASGYLARAAFLLDRLLGRFGLSGRSFLPLTTSFACAIPGIVASRIIQDERDRLATIAVAPLMSCSARLPVYVLLVGAFFPPAQAGLVLLGLYLVGIAAAALVALVLRRTLLRGGRSPLLMELPVYQRPSVKVVLAQVRAACREFARLAGTVIVAAAVVIWLLSYYPRPGAIHERFAAERQGASVEATLRLDAAERAAYLEQSYLAHLGKALQPALAPAGFDWRTTVGILAAFPARELIVPTLGILHSLGDVDPGSYDLATLRGNVPDGLRQKLREAQRPDGSRSFDALGALALMVFFALCSQCAGTLGAIRRETRSWRWPLFTFTYMTVLAWVAATVVFQTGRLLGLGGAA